MRGRRALGAGSGACLPVDAPPNKSPPAGGGGAEPRRVFGALPLLPVHTKSPGHTCVSGASLFSVAFSFGVPDP